MNRKLLLILFAVISSSCQDGDLNGHYVSVDKSINKFYRERYLTLDIIDSLVILNKRLVFSEQKDTIVIDRSTRKFIKSLKVDSQIYDFKVTGNELFLQTDYGEWIKFIRKEVSTSDYFSNSLIDIEPEDYASQSQVQIQNLNFKNVIVGKLKTAAGWEEATDSIYMEYENEVFIHYSDIARLNKVLVRDTLINWSVCLHLDRGIPDSLAFLLKSDLLKIIGKEKLFESRLDENELVYIKLKQN